MGVSDNISEPLEPKPQENQVCGRVDSFSTIVCDVVVLGAAVVSKLQLSQRRPRGVGCLPLHTSSR